MQDTIDQFATMLTKSVEDTNKAFDSLAAAMHMHAEAAKSAGLTYEAMHAAYESIKQLPTSPETYIRETYGEKYIPIYYRLLKAGMASDTAMYAIRFVAADDTLSIGGIIAKFRQVQYIPTNNKPLPEDTESFVPSNRHERRSMKHRSKKHE